MNRLTQISRVIRMTDGLPSSFGVLLVCASALARKAFSRFKPSREIGFVHEGKRFSLEIEDMADLAAVYEAFVMGEYELKDIGPVKKVFDLGANIGVTAAYFSLRYPEAAVYSVEASPKMFERLKRNVAKYPNVRPIFGAVSAKKGQIEFYVNKSSLSSSLVDRSGTTEKVSVPSVSLDDLAKGELGPVDVLKFDIEGAEYEIFDAYLGRMLSARALVGEIHPDIAGRNGDEILGKLEGFSTETVPTGGKRFMIKAYRN